MSEIMELEEIAKPIVKYLKNNYNPHTSLIIDCNSIRLIEDKISIPITDNKEE